ncbi:MAG: hypothetical protein QXN78_03035 [Conexivisphaerales archaeon]
MHKRNHKNAMHIISRRVVECTKSRDIDTIVIGHNDGWKQSVNMGRKTTCANSIKHAQAEENDINVFVINGSHTSKCSFLDSESITIHVGSRISMGLFRSQEGKIINAIPHDKKGVPESFC